MTHVETETLAMIALGDTPVSDEAGRHLAVCSLCADELSSLERVLRLGRSAGRHEFVAPPASVWDGIREELGLVDHLTESAPERGITPSPTREATAEPAPSDARETNPSPTPTAPRRRTPPRGGRRTTGRPARRRWLPVAASALAVGLVAGTGLGLWWQADRGAPAAVVVADATLEALPDWPGAGGTAVVDERPDGSRQVVVTVDDAAQTGPGLREVWLLGTDGRGLVSIGYLTGAEGRFDIPASLDLAVYPFVDVSAEEDDGDPAHSGDSIVRGELHRS